ncbi:hypothetical protein COCOR_05824 [Corallococcus coralloides DSM 2259]|uniref:DUF6310 domain-containing protein n=1 Tax=Corallococcus coralloides (strain ATCC 25202 / DSM 2259 / NBRC 100086 / M2) TaxID=1144275 RepID=H8MGZ1_CORCM|nr:DUF6310 domain-containing protein [Corallococcus coralloides]AFE06602.1 hypothetical protein COCOR_05824 [Corallococcus coralloides DSM 2259]
MRLRACAALLLFLSACATTPPGPGGPTSRNPRIANLQRAAALPWTDGGRCVVREAFQPWPVLMERCYQALDHERIEVQDTTGRCAVASAGAAAVGIGFCVLAAPEIAVGAVIVLGVVVVAVAIKEALDAYELRHLYPEEAAASRGAKGAPRETVAKRKPKLEPEPAGRDWQPPVPPVPVGRSRRDNCEPIPVNHRGGNDPHNKCADKIPNNSFPGWDVFVNGKNFDALQLATRVLWEVKTDNFDTFSEFLQGQVIRDQVPEMRIERELARACGFVFRVGVRSEEHKEALEEAAPDLKGFIVVMDWC